MGRFFFVVTLVLSPVLAHANNLQLIESSPFNGFAIYRTGAPDAKDVSELCKLGVTEMMVLSGDAEQHETKYASSCPGLKVVYNVKQDADVPLTANFLNKFDKWVQDSQLAGKKIAFRCSCGCHRTGRLAAYYQMKYQNITSNDSLILMDKYGQVMWLHKNLKPQTYALEDFIKSRPCSVEAKYCVQ
jgi:hypothetical protein